MVDKTWLPQGYEVPKTGGNYMKFEEGANKFRILSELKTGWIYWTVDKKPARLKEKPKEKPADMRADSQPKHFWAFVVWNYKENAVQILEITQAGIQREIQDLAANPDWGNPTQYDITVNRRGKTMNDTEYTVMPSPHKLTSAEILNAYEAMTINLDALFDGDDPFNTESKNSDNEEMMIEDNPFGTGVI